MAEYARVSACGCDEAPGVKGLMPVDVAIAQAHVLAQRLPGNELVSLATAAGRVLARDLHAPQAMPFFDNSAMDGYAVRTSDFVGCGPWLLPVAGPLGAGDGEVPALPQTPVALRIFTGAPLPEGFDAVVMQEYVEVDGAGARFTLQPRPGQHVRRRGEDVERGVVLAASGTRLEPRHLGLLAANGYAAVNVVVRPRVGVFSTGDELIEPGAELAAAQLYDANRAMLVSLAASAGAIVSDLGIVRDNLQETAGFLDKQLGCFDLLISSGAVSVGGKDHVKAAFEQAGGAITLWKAAMKPGKPVMFGRGRGTVFAGLPGNSFAAYMGFRLFLEGMIERMQGLPALGLAMQAGTADFDWTRSTGRTEFFPVRCNGVDTHGNASLLRLGHGGSASLYPLGQADGIAMVSAQTARVIRGDGLQWHRFA